MLVTDKLFVYGTLKRGFHNHRILKDCRYLSTAITKPAFDMFAGAFPVVMEGNSPDARRVYGEIYQITPEVIEECDALEGEGEMYHRRICVVEARSDKLDHQAFIYIGDPGFWSERDFRHTSKDYIRTRDGYLEWRPAHWLPNQGRSM